MKARFKVNSALKGVVGVENIRTDCLLLTTIAGTELGPAPRAVDEKLQGVISRKLQSPKVEFNGDVGQLIHIKPRKGPAKNITLVGLGEASPFRPQNLCKAVNAAVRDAIDRGLDRISIPFPPNNLTQISLAGQAKIIHEVVEVLLASGEYSDLEGEFEVELVCSPRQARFLQEGLDIPLSPDSFCCTVIEDDDDE